MQNKQKYDESRTGSKIPFRLIWAGFMVIAYFGMSYLVLFTPMLLRYNDRNDPTDDRNFLPRIILGVVLAAYGLFRGYRLWKERR